MATRGAGSPEQRVAQVEAAFAAKIADARFLPHIVLHEYEAWIYSDPHAAAWVFEDPRVPPQLSAIAESMGGPEDIDEGRKTAPSKRLKQVFPQYQKTLHGPWAVEATGLTTIRAACPHMSAWLMRLEQP